jgi:hypothetical protein
MRVNPLGAESFGFLAFIGWERLLRHNVYTLHTEARIFLGILEYFWLSPDLHKIAPRGWRLIARN